MSGGYSPGTANAGALVGAKSASAQVQGGTTTLFTTTMGTTAYILAASLQCVNAQLSTQSVTMTANAVTLLTCGAVGPGDQTQTLQNPPPFGNAVPSAATCTITAPANVIAVGNVWYVEL